MTASNQNPTPTAEKRPFMTRNFGGITLGWQEALSGVVAGGATYAATYIFEKSKESAVKRGAEISTAFIVSDAHSPIEPRMGDAAFLVAEQVAKVDDAKSNFNQHMTSGGTIALSLMLAVTGAAICNRLLRKNDIADLPSFTLR